MRGRVAEATSPPSAPRRRRTSFGSTVLVGLISAALATAASTRTWAEAETRDPALRLEQAAGVDVAPVVLPLAMVALAAWGTVLVLRRWGRRAVAVVGLLAAAGLGVSALVSASGAADVARRMLGGGGEVAQASTTGWPWVAAAAGLVSAAAFAVAVIWAPAWPEMSARYDAPADPGRADGAPGKAGWSQADMWRSLDAGEDPTA